MDLNNLDCYHMFSIHCILHSAVVIQVLIEPHNTEWFVPAAPGHMTPVHSWVEITLLQVTTCQGPTVNPLNMYTQKTASGGVTEDLNEKNNDLLKQLDV